MKMTSTCWHTISRFVFYFAGEKHGYHPLTFGLYLDQIVRHADPKQRSLSEYFEQEIANQFGKIIQSLIVQ